jgi:hypothetical protein
MGNWKWAMDSNIKFLCDPELLTKWHEKEGRTSHFSCHKRRSSLVLLATHFSRSTKMFCDEGKGGVMRWMGDDVMMGGEERGGTG